ncbi:MAG TPA: hypothetical protein VGR62_16250 [Candidatus Binatia bacterium]|jgi:uncharacterized delta-60 repeat protein|nr:hypothetical protein [Candidatus Binatia bacterium]
MTVAVLVAPQRALAVAGALDPTFGAGGVAITAFGPDYDYLDEIAIQTDGRIVVGGATLVGGTLAFAVARYTDAGTLDATFGTGGVTTIDFGSTSDEVKAIAIQPDGKVVVAGRAIGDQFSLARLTPQGGLDPSFDGDGKVTTSTNATNGAQAMLLQPDGKIVVVGGAGRFSVVRYLPNGALDPTFDGDGKAQINVGFGSAEAKAVALQPDGRLLVTGMGPTQNFTVARITSAGVLDPTFSGDGIATMDFAMTPTSTQDDAFAVLVQPDGRIVLGGWSCQPDDCHVAMARLESDGDPDPTFSTDGKLLTRVSRDTSTIGTVLLQPDGKIVAVGSAWGSTYYDELAIRYDADGALDTTFGGDGIVTTPIGTSTNFGRGAALDARGRILIAGYAYLGTYDWTITRHLNDPECGDGIVDDGEQCDGGACCNPACSFAAASVTCRPAAGDCDVAETCSGTAATCPSDARRVDACRPAIGPCDVVEACDGVTNDCPPDVLVTDGTTCGDGVFCNGADVCAAGECAHAGDPCAAGSECADACDEVDASCSRPAGTPCTDDGSVCSVDRCDGAGACAHEPANAGLACRGAAGACDVAESCTGADVACPADAKRTDTCRPAQGACDTAELCDGATDDCPADASAMDGTSCDDGVFCNGTDACASGACAHVGDPCADGAECADACDESARRCATPAGVPCGDDGSVCSLDACDGDGACVHTPDNAGLVCRESSGACDVAERCTGVDAACPVDTGIADDADADGTCDTEDVCPQTPDPEQRDRDGDGLGDACDPCTNDGTQYATTAKVAATRLLVPGGDDTLKLSGVMLLSAVDPARDGARIVFGDAVGILLDVALPGGAGWKTNATRTSFRFGANPGPQGVRKMTLKNVAGRWRVTVVGKRGSYGGRPLELPVWAVVSLRAADGYCAEWTFPGSPGPTCRLTGAGTGVTCR